MRRIKLLSLPHATLGRPKTAGQLTLKTRAEWDATGESMWCVINKLVHLNALRPTVVRELFISASPTSSANMTFWEKRQRLHLGMERNVRAEVVIANTNLTAETYPVAFVDAFNAEPWEDLFYCPACLESGFHTSLFQTFPSGRCPWHGLRIERGCPTCGDEIKMFMPAGGSLKPFRCRSGHALWPGINDGPWIGGPSAEQRRGILEVSRYLRQAEADLSSKHDSRIALICRHDEWPSGWSPAYRSAIGPPAILERALGFGVGARCETATSPVPLDEIPEIGGSPQTLLDTDFQRSNGNPAALAATPSGRLFCRTALEVMVDTCETFFRELEEVLSEHHADCSIGLDRNRTWDLWEIRDPSLCIWKAAVVLTRAACKVRVRDYGKREWNIRAVKAKSAFCELYDLWRGGTRSFLGALDGSAEAPANSAFCAWLANAFLRDYLRHSFVRQVRLLISEVSLKERVYAFSDDTFCAFGHAVVDFRAERPVVTFPARGCRFPLAVRSIRKGIHDHNEILHQLGFLEP